MPAGKGVTFWAPGGRSPTTSMPRPTALRSSTGSPRSMRLGMACGVAPIDGPFCVDSLWPVARSNSGPNSSYDDWSPPEIMTLTSAATVAPARTKHATAAREMERILARMFMVVPPIVRHRLFLVRLDRPLQVVALLARQQADLAQC